MEKTKKQRVIEMFEQGKKAREISRVLDMYDANVYAIIQHYKRDKELASLKVEEVK